MRRSNAPGDIGVEAFKLKVGKEERSLITLLYMGFPAQLLCAAAYNQ